MKKKCNDVASPYKVKRREVTRFTADLGAKSIQQAFKLQFTVSLNQICTPDEKKKHLSWSTHNYELEFS
jgi:hypothetical protein